MSVFQISSKIKLSGILGMLLVLGSACGIFPSSPSPDVAFTTPVPEESDTPPPTTTPQLVQPTALQVRASFTPIPSVTTLPKSKRLSPSSPTTESEFQGTPTAVVLQNAFCRRGPGINYDKVTAFETGTRLEINGRNAETTWWRVAIEATDANCYISASLLQVSGDLDIVDPVPDPPTPTPIPPTSTPTPPSPTLLPPDTPTLLPTSSPSPTLLPPDAVTSTSTGTPPPTPIPPTPTPIQPTQTLLPPDTLTPTSTGTPPPM